jgi:RNA polymerase-interacting CarD/CdnL/TRCF family regulator
MDMKFSIGDRVVHPQQGVGYVAKLEEKQFEPNHPRMLCDLNPDTTVWVPVIIAGLSVERRERTGQCRQVLQATPRPLTPDRSLLASLVSHVNQGTITAHCEVVRDLNAFGWHKPLYGAMAEFQRVISNVLSQEWALSMDICDRSLPEISILLKKPGIPGSRPGRF